MTWEVIDPHRCPGAPSAPLGIVASRPTGMTSPSDYERVFPFTPSISKRERLTSSAAGNKQPRRSRVRWMQLPIWNKRNALTITVQYRGGAETWWLIKARGTYGIFPGCMALDDVMARVHSER